MKIRKIRLHVGAEKPFTLFHMSDNHICLADSRDNERKNTLAVSRNEAFTRNSPPDRQTKNTEELLDYVKAAGAPLLHTGDFIDFTSEANFDYARRTLAGVDVLMAVGNHEFSQYVGEAWEDEAYKAETMANVLAAFPDGILFGVRVICGVKIITLDNNYYYVTPELLDRLKTELSDGIPAILAMHNPLFSEDLYSQVTAGKKPEDPPYLVGCPEERLRSLSEHRYNQQKPDAVTTEFLHFCESCPNLRAVLAGHLHKFYESNLDSGIPQIVCTASCVGEMIEYEIL